MVVIGRAPTVETGVTHDRVASPPRCTVHAPHCAIPQPNLVPVKPSVSRNTQSSGMSPGTLTRWDWPLTERVKSGMGAPLCGPSQKLPSIRTAVQAHQCHHFYEAPRG